MRQVARNLHAFSASDAPLPSPSLEVEVEGTSLQLRNGWNLPGEKAIDGNPVVDCLRSSWKMDKRITMAHAAPADRFGFPLLDPWVELAEPPEPLVAELRKELRPDHLLFGLAAEAWARRSDGDDVLFRITGRPEQFAVVHLTWLGKPDPHRGWPSTELYLDAEDWRERCMLPDHTLANS